ncbi:MAG: helix-turn-helix domain-containing protein [Clostridia bacterium]|nr:helix-turn-helix domain-containing protein [Clostridia bacterium]
MDGNFIKVHNNLVRSKELRPTEKIVYMCIKAYAYTGECFPSVKRLAEDAGVCMRTVQRCIKVLCGKGLLTVERRKNANGGNATNLYRIEEKSEEGARKKLSEFEKTSAPADPRLEFRGSDEMLRRLGVTDTEKYRRIYRRIARLGLEHRGEVMQT